MVENRPWVTYLTHIMLVVGVLTMAFPIYLTFVASTHTLPELLERPMPVLPGSHFIENYSTALTSGVKELGVSVGRMMFNSLIMALGITVGKIFISLLAAFAIVYFKFRFRMFFFWLIFVTLMLPVEVRIIPTYKVVADLGMLDNYVGLTLPLIASATATFLFRQVFLAVPDELAEAARIDGAGPVRFFFDILVPITRTNMAAMFVILFIYGWNQYLWPLLITTDENMYTIIIGINRMLAVGDDFAEWQVIMATTMLAMLPPVVIVVSMQKLFVKGLTETEK
ncbi:MAG: sn-glycerol-3-phosphate ABC transporter permease UgpE [Deltaproteobacteria bacterium]|nr:sn-glycerol-3-phosphate ABC transporter permease UgpE [Deltaproteobacteria bacterium]